MSLEPVRVRPVSLSPSHVDYPRPPIFARRPDLARVQGVGEAFVVGVHGNPLTLLHRHFDDADHVVFEDHLRRLRSHLEDVIGQVPSAILLLPCLKIRGHGLHGVLTPAWGLIAPQPEQFQSHVELGSGRAELVETWRTELKPAYLFKERLVAADDAGQELLEPLLRYDVGTLGFHFLSAIRQLLPSNKAFTNASENPGVVLDLHRLSRLPLETALLRRRPSVCSRCRRRAASSVQ
jgi:hypothetical protein